MAEEMAEERMGVALLGFDVPSKVSADAKLRVIAAVECRDASSAPSLVALIVRDKVRNTTPRTNPPLPSKSVLRPM